MQPYGPPAQAPGFPPAAVPTAIPREAFVSHVLVIIAGAVIGIALFTGLVAYHAVFLIQIPGGITPSPEVAAYRETVRLLGWISVVAMDLAVSFTVTIAWIVGASRSEVPESTRRGIFIFATVFLAVWIVFSFAAYSIFRAIIGF